MIPALLGIAKAGVSAYAAGTDDSGSAPRTEQRTDNSQVYFGSYNPPKTMPENVGPNWLALGAVVVLGLVAVKR